jgi:hypothetical protein
MFEVGGNDVAVVEEQQPYGKYQQGEQVFIL